MKVKASCTNEYDRNVTPLHRCGMACHAAWQVYEQVLIAALDIDDQQLVTVSWHQLR